MADFTIIEWVIYALVAFGASIMSGVAGGGGGFILTPLLIFFGLSPASSISTGKLAGLAVSLGSLQGLRKVKIRSIRSTILILIIALIVGILSSFVIRSLDSDFYRKSLGIVLLVLIPFLMYKKVGHTEKTVSEKRKFLGFGLVTVTLGLQGVFSSGIGAFVNVVMMEFLGMSALEANVVKRYSQIALNSMIILGVLFSGLIVWEVAIIGFLFSIVGGYIGGHIAWKRGNVYVLNVFMILMFISGLALFFG